MIIVDVDVSTLGVNNRRRFGALASLLALAAAILWRVAGGRATKCAAPCRRPRDTAQPRAFHFWGRRATRGRRRRHVSAVAADSRRRPATMRRCDGATMRRSEQNKQISPSQQPQTRLQPPRSALRRKVLRTQKASSRSRRGLPFRIELSAESPRHRQHDQQKRLRREIQGEDEPLSIYFLQSPAVHRSLCC